MKINTQQKMIHHFDSYSRFYVQAFYFSLWTHCAVRHFFYFLFLDSGIIFWFRWFEARQQLHADREQSGSNRSRSNNSSSSVSSFLAHCNTHPSILANNWIACFFYSCFKHTLGALALHENPFGYVFFIYVLYAMRSLCTCALVQSRDRLLYYGRFVRVHVLVFVQYAKAKAKATAMAKAKRQKAMLILILNEWANQPAKCHTWIHFNTGP